MRRLAAAALCLALLPDPAAARPAEVSRGSAFALPVTMREAGSDAVLAQRVIDRSWGASDDSIYVEVEVPHWRSEGTALALSALVPGTGQLYAGERTGLLFLAGEAVGWFEWWYMRHRGEKIRGDARVFAGDPNDSLSRWTFGNYEQRTGLSTDELRQLYASDRTVFYYLIGRDDRYATGWGDYNLGYNAIDRQRFLEIREDSEAHFKRSRYFQAAIWTHHVLAALHAKRAARLRNLELAPPVRLGLRPGFSRGHPTLAAVIETRF